MDNLESILEKKLVQLKREYPRALNRDLAKHHIDQLFARNVIHLQQQIFSELKQELALNSINKTLLSDALKQQIETFIQIALKHNRSSCAISNFVDEHNPSRAYIGDVFMQCQHLLKRFLDELESPSQETASTSTLH